MLMVVTRGRADAKGPDTVKILHRVTETAARPGALQGEFKQDVDMNLMQETRNYRGRIYYRHPDLLRLEYEEPVGELLVCDGSSYWMLLTDRERPQVYRTPLEGNIGGILSERTLEMLLSDYSVRLSGEEKASGVSCYRFSFSLRAGSNKPRFQSLDLWVGKEDLLSRRLSYKDMAGNVVTYSFFGWQRVDSLPDKLFLFTPPPDADFFDAPWNR